MRSGKHLGAMRNFIQWHAHRGEYLTWGSQELAEMAPSMFELEDLAERIANAAAAEVLRHIAVCSEFKWRPSASTNAGRCGTCGYPKKLHELQAELVKENLMTITFGQIKVESEYAAGALAERGWWVATPGNLGDFILAADLGAVDGGRLFEDQQGRRVVLDGDPEDGLEVVRFLGEREP